MTGAGVTNRVRQLAGIARELDARGWISRAACRHVDPELFFPIGTTGPALVQVKAAKAVCARCPVAAECLDWAVRTGQDHGVWGGTTPEERRSIRRRAST